MQHHLASGYLNDERHSQYEPIREKYKKNMSEVARLSNVELAFIEYEAKRRFANRQSVYDTLVYFMQDERKNVVDALAREGDRRFSDGTTVRPKEADNVATVSAPEPAPAPVVTTISRLSNMLNLPLKK